MRKSAVLPLFAPLLIGGVLGWSTRAAAHGEGTLTGQIPYLDASGELTGATLGYGLTFFEPDQDTAYWTPEETVPGGVVLWIHASASDRLLVGTYAGPVRSTDFGCSWAAETNLLGGEFVAAVDSELGNPDHVFAATAPPVGDGSVYESTDGGDTWTPLAPIADGYFFQTLLVDPSAQTLWVSGTRDNDPNNAIFRSDDAGTSWQPVAADLSPYPVLRLLSYDPNTDRLFFRARTVDNTEVLLFSDDGLNTVVQVSLFANRILSAGQLGPHLLVVVNENEGPVLYRSTDGSPFEEDSTGPQYCVDMRSEPGVLWGCAEIPGSSHFLRSVDGVTWEPRLPFSDLQPRTCADGTPGADFVPLFWELVTEEVDRRSQTPSPPDPPPMNDPDPIEPLPLPLGGDDGCAQLPWVWPGIGLIGLAMRRHRPRG